MRKTIVPTHFIDRPFVLSLECLRPLYSLLVAVGVPKLCTMLEHTYDFLTYEFLSSFSYDSRATIVNFRLLNTDYSLTTAEFGALLGFPIEDVEKNPSRECIAEVIWSSLTSTVNVDVSKLRVSQIKHPVLRYFCRLVAGTFFGRTDPRKRNKVDLLILGSAMNMQCLEYFKPDVAHFMLSHFQHVVIGRITTIAIGGDYHPNSQSSP